MILCAQEEITQLLEDLTPSLLADDKLQTKMTRTMSSQVLVSGTVGLGNSKLELPNLSSIEAATPSLKVSHLQTPRSLFKNAHLSSQDAKV